MAEDEVLKDYQGHGYVLKFLKTRYRARHIRAAVKALKPILNKFDSIAFTGMSGALIAPIIADKLGKHVIMVRKAGTRSHSYYKVEGYMKTKNYVIVDDFVDTGATCKRIKKLIKTELNPEAKCLGVLPVQELKGTGSGWQRTSLQEV